MKNFPRAVPLLLLASLLYTPGAAVSSGAAAAAASYGQQSDAAGVYDVRAFGAPTFVVKNVEDFSLQQSRPLPDTVLERTTLKKF